jgi:hypothetical protein
LKDCAQDLCGACSAADCCWGELRDVIIVIAGARCSGGRRKKEVRCIYGGRSLVQGGFMTRD